MKRFWMFFILIGITVGILLGVSNQKENNEDIIRENTEIELNDYVDELTLSVSEIDTLNPLRTKKLHVSYILQLIYEPLFMYNDENQISGVLAEEWMKRDDLTWIIRIKDYIEWHDGEKLTTQDVAYTINTLINQEIDSIYSTNVQKISSVEIVNEKDLIINLKEPEPYLISKLTFPIISKKHFEGEKIFDENISNKMLGTGPYKYVTEYDSSIVLTSNENWWKNENIKLKTINLNKYSTYSEAIKAFKSSEIDMILTNMYDWKEKFGFIGINSYKFENTEYEVLIPNSENKILSDNSVRKAILYGINRANIVSTIYHENAVISDMPIMTYSQNAEINSEYNIETAKQILINGGWKQENGQWKKADKTLKFTLLVSKDDKEKVSVAEKIKQDLKEIDIKVTVKEVDNNEFVTAIENNKFEIAITSLDVKNEYQIQDLVLTGNKYNYANYTNVEMDNLIETLKKLEVYEYDEKFQELKKIYKNDLPYIGLYFKTNTILTNKSVKGEYKSTAYEPYKNINNFCK
ncbi:MAG: peptide ABC transporter substrate-binding protein [Clostridia bacterium]|nr:peptide ABC transporter substrate-binding protein [Clostridia bacterium]